MCVPGPIAPLYSIGWRAIHVISKPTSEIEFPTSWSLCHLTSGIMSVESRIQLTVLRGDFSHPNSWIIACGGMVLNGSSLNYLNGPSRTCFHQMPHQTKKVKFLFTASPSNQLQSSHWTIILPISGSNMLLPGFSGSLITVSLTKGESLELPALSWLSKNWRLLRDTGYYFHKEILILRMSRLLKKVVRLHNPVASYLCIHSRGLLRVGGRPSCLTTANTLLLFMGSTC